ncbi:MAG: O-antigen ligase family protein [Alcaligenaceae bacterium]|nr:O-antigen ligase family protein [Alcaligenaceae bacterium]
MSFHTLAHAGLQAALVFRISVGLFSAFFLFMYLILAFLLAVQPFANLNSSKTPSGLFYVTLAVCLILLIQRRFAGAGQLTRDYQWVVASFSVLLLAVAGSSLYYGDWAGANGEGAIRLFFGFWVVLLALTYVPYRYLQWGVMGIAVAGVISAAVVLTLILPDFVRPDTPAHNAVTYGNYMAYMAVVAAYSLGWQQTRWPRAERVLKALAAVISLAGFVLTQTRSGWVAMPVFVLVAVALFVGWQQWRRALVAAMVMLAALVAVFASSDIMRDRAVLAYDEVVSCRDSNYLENSSICVRLQLYRASVDMFVQHPLAGLGDGSRFQETMVNDSHPKGLVGDFVVGVDDYFGEPHNDLLFMLASFGLPGFMGLLLVYLVPCGYFLKRLGQVIPQPARVAAAMGLALCLGFLVFGLTETMFRRMHTLSFYAVFVAVFLSLSDPRRYSVGKPGV